MAKATASPPARSHSADRPRGKAKTPKHKTKETSPPKHESAWKHEINRGFIAPFLLTRSVHFLAAIWHNLSPLLTPRCRQAGKDGGISAPREAGCRSRQSAFPAGVQEPGRAVTKDYARRLSGIAPGGAEKLNEHRRGTRTKILSSKYFAVSTPKCNSDA